MVVLFGLIDHVHNELWKGSFMGWQLMLQEDWHTHTHDKRTADGKSDTKCSSLCGQMIDRMVFCLSGKSRPLAGLATDLFPRIAELELCVDVISRKACSGT